MSGIIGGAGSKSGVIGTTELDYEEGTFTITHGTHGISGQEGKYVRIGNLVSVHIEISFNVDSRTSAAAFSTLPFTSDGSQGQGGIAWPNSVAFYNSNYSILAMRIAPSAATFTFYGSGHDQGVNNTITTNNGSSVYAEARYITADSHL